MAEAIDGDGENLVVYCSRIYRSRHDFENLGHDILVRTA